MAATRFITVLAFTLLFTLSVSSDPADLSPAPAPETGADSPPSIPSPSPSTSSPPAPPPASDLAPTPASIPSPATSSPPSVSPAPVNPDADLSSANVKSEESNKSESGGMSGGKKAGIAIGVIAAACVVGFGGMLYKKRQQNIRRAEFSSAARTEFL